jgi:hypothetical protein
MAAERHRSQVQHRFRREPAAIGSGGSSRESLTMGLAAPSVRSLRDRVLIPWRWSRAMPAVRRAAGMGDVACAMLTLSVDHPML